MADRLDEIRARADAATPGPWGVWTSMDNTRDILSEAEHPAVPLVGLYGRDGSEHPTAGEDADAEFIAAARSDVPFLLDRLAASEQEAARLRAVLDWTEALEAWASNALGIVKDQRIPSADVIADGEAILAGVREALGPVKEDQADATE
jgi:hypothetical protein